MRAHTRGHAHTPFVAILTAVLLLLLGCGAPPESQSGNSDGSGTGGAGNGPAAADFKACMVTDQGGIDDRSFNTLGWKGMTDARDKFGIEVQYLESTSVSDFVPNIEQFVDGDCDLIVTIGFLLADATKRMAKKYPEQNFLIVDFAYSEPIENVKPIVFDSSQSAFLAGYLAAGITESGTVATFGGVKIPPVTLYMDGFVQGVQHYNEGNDTDVKVLGWNMDSRQGVFVGNFTDQAKGKTVTQNFIRQGADVIFPLAGAVNLGSAAAVDDAAGVKMIWVDSDGCVSAPNFCDLFWSSALKNIDVAVTFAIKQTLDGKFSNETYVGTLANGGVGLAPFHKHADDISGELKQELDRVRQAVIDGEITIASLSKPTG